MPSEYGITPVEIFSSSDPFGDAAEFTNTTANIVVDQIDNINSITDSTLILATDAIDKLKKLSDIIDVLPDYTVSPPELDPVVTVEFDVPDIDERIFGAVTSFDVDNTIDTGNLPVIGQVTIPGFDPTPLTISIPDAPIPGSFTVPGDAPDAPALTFPTAPVITLPDSPNLAPIVIPVFTSPVIADFDPVFPTFSEQTIQTLIDWQEPVYTEEVIDEVKDQLTIFFTGGSGIRPDIEDSIFARGRDREDRTVRQQEQQATAEWAGKGFTAPPGMLVKRIDNIREDGTLKKLGLNREQTIKVFDTEVDNLRFAVQQGIAAEEIYVRMFLAKVERLFEVQKLSIQWQIELYGLAIQVFGIQMEEVKIRAQVYEVQVRAALIEIEVFKALIEGEKVKAEINKVLIDAYVAEIGARIALVRIYSEQVTAVGIEADVFNTQINAYRGEVEAYAARIGADKNRFDAYASRIRGEGAKADILSSEAQAYASEVQGIETGVRAEVAALEGEVSAIEVQIRNFEAIVRGMIGRAQVQLGGIQANVAGHNANTQRFVASTGAEEAVSKVELIAHEGKNRTNLEIFKADVVAFQATLERAVKEIELRQTTENAAGGLAATITAGALAAASVGASISGTGSVGAIGSNSFAGNQAESVSCTSANNSNVTAAVTFDESGVPCVSFDHN